MDAEGISYVVDAAFENVQMFNNAGRLLLNFGDSWGLRGGMDLPAGICVVEGGMPFFQKYVHPGFEVTRLIFVTNQFGADKVNVYALGRMKSGQTIVGPTTMP